MPGLQRETGARPCPASDPAVPIALAPFGQSRCGLATRLLTGRLRATATLSRTGREGGFFRNRLGAESNAGRNGHGHLISHVWMSRSSIA